MTSGEGYLIVYGSVNNIILNGFLKPHKVIGESAYTHTQAFTDSFFELYVVWRMTSTSSGWVICGALPFS